tara:strand:+ start:43 stop:189 length:147 start_codon:yes stop_codon:yes gene_type:complete
MAQVALIAGFSELEIEILASLASPVAVTLKRFLGFLINRSHLLCLVDT